MSAQKIGSMSMISIIGLVSLIFLLMIIAGVIIQKHPDWL